MDERALKYGFNPNQANARIYIEEGELPFKVINGTPGMINFLDALNGWQLVRELKRGTGLAAAASFKHVSPAGVGLGVPLSDTLTAMYLLGDEPLSPIAMAYARARGADRLCSFGDFIALSDVCDQATATLIKREVSDGVIAPGYTEEAMAILSAKRKGSYVVLQIDETYEPKPIEKREVFGLTLEQGRNDLQITTAALKDVVTKQATLPEEVKRDLILALITLKYTQSNSVCYAYEGQTIGIGAGQQSRVHCARLAGDKADHWRLRSHPKVLGLPFREKLSRPDKDNAIDRYIIGEVLDATLFTEMPEPLTEDEKNQWIAGLSGVSLASDGFFPFSDSIDRAAASGVAYVAQPGGSVRDDEVIAACDGYGIAMANTGFRLFHH